MTDRRDSVLAVAQQMVEAFGRHDTEAYFSFFTKDASFIFHNLDRTLKSRAEYEAEWALWERRDGFRVLSCQSSDRMLQMAGDGAGFTHTVVTKVFLGGEALTNRERETIVFRTTEGRWLAFHEHLSPLLA